MGLFTKKCECKNTNDIYIANIRYKKCVKCGQEFMLAPVYTWLRVEKGTIEKEQKK